MTVKDVSAGGRPRRRRPGELLALELPVGEERARPARSPAAWLHAVDRRPDERPETRRLAEHYAGRAVRRGGRWVVMLGDHKPRRAFRRLVGIEVAAVACAPGRALLSPVEAEALLGLDGITPADLRPLYDRAPDCSALGAIRVRESLERLVELGHASVRFHADRVSGVIAIPNHLPNRA